MDLAIELEDKVELISMGSPYTINHYLNKEDGMMYGLSPTMRRYHSEHAVHLRPEVPEIPGLFLSGQDIVTAGYKGAQTSGIMSAAVALGNFKIFTDFQFHLEKAPFYAKKKDE